MATHFLEAHPIRIIKKRDNGSGVIEIPIMATTVAGAESEITVAMMQELVDNFASFPVVPVGVSPHKDFDERSGFSPAFVESVRLEGDELFGRIDLIAPLFNEVVELGGWRGFSVEIAHNLKTQAKSIAGWTLTGGVFTNRPAVDAHFKIAAEGRSDSETTGTYTAPLYKESVMADTTATPAAKSGETESVRKSFFDEKIKEQTDMVAALEAGRAELDRRNEATVDENKRLRLEAEEAKTTATDATNDKLTAEAKSNRLEAEARGLKEANLGLKKALTEAETRLIDEAKVNTATKVLAVRDWSIKSGVAPRMFEGIESDPATWMQQRFASIDAFEQHYADLAGVSRDNVTDVPRSGHSPSKSSGEQHNLSAEDQKRLRRIGLNPKYVGIKSEGELIDMKFEEKDKKGN